MSKLAFELEGAAEAEFYDIVDYYKQFDHELSNDFIQEFEDAAFQLFITLITHHGQDAYLQGLYLTYPLALFPL